MARLALAVEKARAECVARKAKRVQEAGEKPWQADAWWLERNLPNLYGRNQRVEVESRSVSVNVSLPALPEQQLLELLQQKLASGRKLLPPPE